MNVYIASDHAGFALKAGLVPFIESLGHQVHDLGAHELEPEDDYPTYVTPCAEAVAGDLGSFGIVIGGSGQGEAMAANRVHGVRAAVYYADASLDGVKMAALTRAHNDANVLSLGARFISEEDAYSAVQTFLSTPFSQDERHIRRIAQY